MIYVTVCPLISFLTKRFSYRLVILCGLIMTGIGFFLVAKSEIFGLEPSSTMIIMGLLLFGVTMPMLSITPMPEILEAIESREDLNYDP